jgi:hypothetical protein
MERSHIYIKNSLLPTKSTSNALQPNSNFLGDQNKISGQLWHFLKRPICSKIGPENRSLFFEQLTPVSSVSKTRKLRSKYTKANLISKHANLRPMHILGPPPKA